MNPGIWVAPIPQPLHPDPTNALLVLLLLAVLFLAAWLANRRPSPDLGASVGSDGAQLAHATVTDPDQLAAAIARTMAQIAPHAGLQLALLEVDRLRWFAQHPAPTGEKPPATGKADDPLIEFGPPPFADPLPTAAQLLGQASPSPNCWLFPIRLMGDPIGAVLVTPASGRAWPEGTVARLQSMADGLAPALDRYRLASEVDRRTTQLLQLGEISRRLITLRPLDERWSEIAPLISRAFDYARVQLFEVHQERAVLQASSHLADASDQADGQALVELAMRNRRQPNQPPHSPPSGPDPAPHQLLLPLMVEDRLLGVLQLRRDPDQPFTSEERSLAEMLADQLAIASLEVQNYAQQQEFTWYNTVLLEVTRHAAQPGDPTSALRAVLQLTTMLAGANWTLLLLPEESGAMVTWASSGLTKEATDAVEALSLPLSRFDLETPVVESDEPFTLALPEPLDAILGEEMCLAMVLSDGSSLLGLLLIGGPPPHGQRRSLLAGIAHQISMRIENTRLIEDLTARRSLEHELDTARGIQESFLPRDFPEHDGWQVGATWLAARQVGGDFFDFIPLQAGTDGPRWGVAIADVADKGVPAALFMALCRSILRSVAAEAGEPAAVLDRVNQIILADSRSEMFVSLFYAIWEPAVDRLTYANGGHNPPFLFSPAGLERQLRNHGMVLGVSPKASYQSAEVYIPAGGLLVLYTDGVTEAMNPSGAYFGEDNLRQVVEAHQGQTAQFIAEAINQRVLEFCATPDPPDDVTTIVLRRTHDVRAN